MKTLSRKLYELELKLADYLPMSGDQGHVFVSFVLTLIFAVCALIFPISHIGAGVIGAVLSFTFGYASELNDAKQPDNYFNRYDIRLNGVGCVIGLILWVLIGALL